MAGRIDLGDPDFEPTDEQLAGLVSRAFAHVAAEQRAAHAKIRREIHAARAEALRALDARASAAKAPRA